MVRTRGSTDRSEPFIHLRGVTQGLPARRASEHLAISDATFDVMPGELVSLVGPSGCGKSTLLKILAGLHPHDGGEVRIGSATHPFDPARDVGMVFQAPLLLKWRRILDNVLLPAEILGLPMAAARERARDLLALVGLHGYEDKYPVRAVRRHAAARGDRALAGARPEAGADGRALRRARRADAREDEPGAAAHLEGGGQDHRLRHPRHLRGGVPRHARGGAHRRARRAWPTTSRSTCRTRARST